MATDVASLRIAVDASDARGAASDVDALTKATQDQTKATLKQADAQQSSTKSLIDSGKKFATNATLVGGLTIAVLKNRQALLNAVKATQAIGMAGVHASGAYEKMSKSANKASEAMRTVHASAKRALPAYAQLTAAVLNMSIAFKNKLEPAVGGAVRGTKASLAEFDKQTTTVFGRTLSTIGSLIKSFGKFRAIAVIVTALIIVGITLYSTISAFSKFEKKLLEVKTILSETGAIHKFGESARRMSRIFGTELVENTQAYYDTVSAGFSRFSQAAQIVEQANKLAIGGVTEVGNAVDILTSSLNAYGLSADDVVDVSDILFTAVRLGKTTIEEMSSALGQVAPIASSAGVDIRTVGAAIATLTSQGIGTSESITGLKAALSNIIKPSGEAINLARELGVEFGAAALQSKGLAGLLQELRTATGGNLTMMSQMFGSVEALNTVLALSKNDMANFISALEDMEESSGATDSAFKIMTEGFWYGADRMKRAWGDMLVTWGQILSPIGKAFMFVLTSTANALNALGEAARNTTRYLMDLLRIGNKQEITFRNAERAIDNLDSAYGRLNNISLNRNNIVYDTNQLEYVLRRSMDNSRESLKKYVDQGWIPTIDQMDHFMSRAPGVIEHIEDILSQSDESDESLNNLRELYEAWTAYREAIEGMDEASAANYRLLQSVMGDVGPGVRAALDAVNEYRDSMEQMLSPIEQMQLLLQEREDLLQRVAGAEGTMLQAIQGRLGAIDSELVAITNKHKLDQETLEYQRQLIDSHNEWAVSVGLNTVETYDEMIRQVQSWNAAQALSEEQQSRLKAAMNGLNISASAYNQVLATLSSNIDEVSDEELRLALVGAETNEMLKEQNEKARLAGNAKLLLATAAIRGWTEEQILAAASYEASEGLENLSENTTLTTEGFQEFLKILGLVSEAEDDLDDSSDAANKALEQQREDARLASDAKYLLAKAAEEGWTYEEMLAKASYDASEALVQQAADAGLTLEQFILLMSAIYGAEEALRNFGDTSDKVEGIWDGINKAVEKFLKMDLSDQIELIGRAVDGLADLAGLNDKDAKALEGAFDIGSGVAKVATGDFTGIIDIINGLGDMKEAFGSTETAAVGATLVGSAGGATRSFEFASGGTVYGFNQGAVAGAEDRFLKSLLETDAALFAALGAMGISGEGLGQHALSQASTNIEGGMEGERGFLGASKEDGHVGSTAEIALDRYVESYVDDIMPSLIAAGLVTSQEYQNALLGGANDLLNLVVQTSQEYKQIEADKVAAQEALEKGSLHHLTKQIEDIDSQLEVHESGTPWADKLESDREALGEAIMDKLIEEVLAGDRSAEGAKRIMDKYELTEIEPAVDSLDDLLTKLGDLNTQLETAEEGTPWADQLESDRRAVENSVKSTLASQVIEGERTAESATQLMKEHGIDQPAVLQSELDLLKDELTGVNEKMEGLDEDSHMYELLERERDAIIRSIEGVLLREVMDGNKTQEEANELLNTLKGDSKKQVKASQGLLDSFKNVYKDELAEFERNDYGDILPSFAEGNQKLLWSINKDISEWNEDEIRAQLARAQAFMNRNTQLYGERAQNMLSWQLAEDRAGALLQALERLADYQRRGTDVLERWDGDGQPEMRS